MFQYLFVKIKGYNVLKTFRPIVLQHYYSRMESLEHDDSVLCSTYVCIKLVVLN